MPLIMLCGGPLSGKSLLAKQLEQACKGLYPEREVTILSHESMNISRQVFANMPTEKKFNQKLISAVEQALTSKRVLIVDYICLTKSLRYQFYGKANFTGTVSCVVNCTTPYETTLERNTKEQRYTPEVFDDLWNRLEAPINTCRWDYPCFDFDCSDPQSFILTDDNTTGQYYNNFSDCLKSICEQSTKALSRSNLPTRNESGAFVTILDKITTSIVEQIIFQQQDKGFVVGALLDSQTCQVEVDISLFLTDTTALTPPSPQDSTQNAQNSAISDKPDPLVPNTDTTVTSAETQRNSTTITPAPSADEGSNATPAPTPTGSSGGLKLVRKIVRGKKGNEAGAADATTTNSAQTQSPTAQQSKYTLTLKTPMSPSALFELKQSFSRIATMMNVKTSHQIAKAFVEYLQPQLNPS